jgi:hypothetical protein
MSQAGLLKPSSGGGSSGALTLIGTQVVPSGSPVATLNFTTGITSASNNYLLAMSNVMFGSAGAAGLLASISTNGGVTWIQTGYQSSNIGLGVLNIANSLSGDFGGATSITMNLSGMANLFNLTSGLGYIGMYCPYTGWEPTPVFGPASPAYAYGNGDTYTVVNTTVNAIQLIVDGTVTFSGTFSLYSYSM